jgi:hypothetical protein
MIGHRVSYHSADTDVLSSQDLTPESGGSKEEITNKTRKTDAAITAKRLLPASELSSTEEMVADEAYPEDGPYMDDADWEDPLDAPYEDDSDWEVEDPPRSGGPRTVAQRQFMAECDINLSSSRSGGGCGEAASGELAPIPATTTRAAATTTAATTGAATPVSASLYDYVTRHGHLPNGRAV